MEFLGILTTLGGSLAVLIGVASWILRLFRRETEKLKSLEKELEEVRFRAATTMATANEASTSVLSELPEIAAPPEFPEALVEAIMSGRAVLYLGSGFSDAVGEPSLSELLRRLLKRVTPPLDHATLASLDSSIGEGKFDFAAETVRRRISDKRLRKYIAEILRINTATGARTGKRHGLYDVFSQLPLSGVLTMLWSTDMEAAYQASPTTQAISLTPGSDELAKLIRDERTFVFHLSGLLQEDQTLLFTSEERQRALVEDSLSARFLSSIVAERPMVFIGATLEEIENVLGFFRGPTSMRRFALVSSQHLSSTWHLQAARLDDRFNVDVRRYVPTPGYPELMQAFADLKARVSAIPASQESVDSPRRLTAIRLENVGVFEKLEVQFNPGWNVILGNNACGKSTILKAIALGLCGDDPRAAEAAFRLLGAGARIGKVELEVGKELFTTELVRELNTVRVSSSALTPLQRGRWVVLGFPPLRGVSVREPAGPVASGADEPQVRDLLPLLMGTVDSRIDDLKQWIVNAHSAPNGEALIAAFFEILRDLTPGESISLPEVQHGSWEVQVKTESGDRIRIDQVSQGMTSTIGWVGTLLARMYEIYPDSRAPQLEPALVLVDEIDAHLHPTWQRILVGLVSKHFKNVQVIATTHSPLVVAGMDPAGVFIARRDPGNRALVNVYRAVDEVNTSGMRADEILTSTLFGLQTTRSEPDAKVITRYSSLIGKDPLTPDEAVELRSLRARIEGWMDRGEPPGARAPAVSDVMGEEPSVPLTSEQQQRADEGLDRVFRRRGLS